MIVEVIWTQLSLLPFWGCTLSYWISRLPRESKSSGSSRSQYRCNAFSRRKLNRVARVNDEYAGEPLGKPERMLGSKLQWPALRPGGNNYTLNRLSCRNLNFISSTRFTSLIDFLNWNRLHSKIIFCLLMANLTCYLGSEEESHKTVNQAGFSRLLAALIQRFPHNSSVSSLLSECVKNNSGVIVISDNSPIN